METTAADYARFLVAIALGTGLEPSSLQEMLRPQVSIATKRMFGPAASESSAESQPPGLAWALGWGMVHTPHGRAFFHTGHDNGWQNYTVTYRDKGVGIVILTNSNNGETMIPEFLERTIGDRHSPFAWLGYLGYPGN